MNTLKNLVLKSLMARCIVACFLMIPLTASAQSKPGGKPLIHPGSSHHISVATSGGAIRSNAGFTSNILGANDDGSTSSVPIGFDLVFGGQTRSYLYVNNNGNVTFDQALWTFTPYPLNIGIAIIAPFLADVDTRDSGSTLVTYGNDTVDGQPAFGVNWVDVGYYAYHTDKLNSFQLVLIDRSDIAFGSFDVEFNYGSINWETGDASGGQDGFGGTAARVGYYDGTNTANSWLELPGSGTSHALLDSGSNALIASRLGSLQLGRYVFHIRNQTPVSLQLLDENTANFGATVVGATADGATQIRVRCRADAPGTVSLVYDRGTPSATPDGTFVPAPGSIGNLNNLTLQLVDGHYQADAIYAVPEGLIDEATHDIFFRGTYTPDNGDGQAIPLEDQTLRLQRPPVILVHGLWSDKKTWEKDGLPKGTLKKLKAAGFKVPTYLFNYGPAYGSYASSHFGDYTHYLIKHIREELKDLRTSHVAATRVDVVSHSMGGLITRTMVRQEPSYRIEDSFGQGLIRRFVTLGTPHLGSPLADALWDLHETSIVGAVADRLAELAHHPIDQGAIEDLRVSSDALLLMGSTSVPSFALIGDINPYDLVEAPVIDLAYNLFRFFGVTLGFLDLSSRGSFINSAMNHQASDFIVPGVSQEGGLDAAFTQRFSPVWHLSETGSDEMGDTVPSLLGGEVSAFAHRFPQPSDLSAMRVQQSRQPAQSKVRKVTETPLVTITSPAPGATFHPGDQIVITAVPISGVTIAAVLITLGDGSGQSSLLQQPPFSATFTIANDFVGSLTYTVAARDSAGNVSIISGAVTVQSNATLQSLAVTPSPLTFSTLGATQLRVYGSFSDGVTRDVTSSNTGTTYSSSDSSVVSVGSDGLATANSAGAVIITIHNGGVDTQMVAQVVPQIPNVLVVDPSSVIRGTVQPITVQGLYLGGASSIQFLSGAQADTQITVDNIQVDDIGYMLTANVTTTTGAMLGAHTVVITTPGWSSSPVAYSGNQLVVLDISALTVTTAGDGSGTVTSTPSGISCPGDCTETYVKDTMVTLTATPSSGSTFAYYTGGCSIASAACALTLASDTAVAAYFVPESTKKVNLTVSKTKTNKGDGTVTSTDGRIDCGKDCKDAYYPGSPVILKAVPLEGSVFSGWSKECPSPDGDTCTLTLDKALTIKAIFIGPYTLKTQKTAKNKGTGTVTSTDGKISCGTDCQESYIYNTLVTLSAAPDPLSVFTSWSGTGITCPGTGTCAVTMDKAKIIKATFTGPSLLKVTITSKNKGSGTVTSDPPGITCAIGSTTCSQSYLYQSPVTLTALPDPGSNFVSFSGCATVSGTTCTVTMDKAKTVKVTFEKPKTTAGPDRIEVYGEGGEEASEGRSVGGTEEEEN